MAEPVEMEPMDGETEKWECTIFGVFPKKPNFALLKVVFMDPDYNTDAQSDVAPVPSTSSIQRTIARRWRIVLTKEDKCPSTGGDSGCPVIVTVMNLSKCDISAPPKAEFYYGIEKAGETVLEDIEDTTFRGSFGDKDNKVTEVVTVVYLSGIPTAQIKTRRVPPFDEKADMIEP